MNLKETEVRLSITEKRLKLDKNSRVYIAGHTGLFGRTTERILREKGYNNIITCTHSELDLTDQAKTKAFFEKEKPEYVFIM